MDCDPRARRGNREFSEVRSACILLPVAPDARAARLFRKTWPARIVPADVFLLERRVGRGRRCRLVVVKHAGLVRLKEAPPGRATRLRNRSRSRGVADG